MGKHGISGGSISREKRKRISNLFWQLLDSPLVRTSDVARTLGWSRQSMDKGKRENSVIHARRVRSLEKFVDQIGEEAKAEAAKLDAIVKQIKEGYE